MNGGVRLFVPPAATRAGTARRAILTIARPLSSPGGGRAWAQRARLAWTSSHSAGDHVCALSVMKAWNLRRRRRRLFRLAFVATDWHRNDATSSWAARQVRRG